MSHEKFLTKAAKIADLLLIVAGGACLLLAVYLSYRFGWRGQERLPGGPLRLRVHLRQARLYSYWVD